MEKITHPELVAALAKPGAEIVASLSAGDIALTRNACSSFVRAGCTIDAMKKRVIYRKPVAVPFEMVPFVTNDATVESLNLTAHKAHLLHMAIGVAGEAAELLEAFVSHVLENDELNEKNVVEELGDIEFYIEGLRQALGITRERTLQQNISKLSKRYAEGRYSNQAAVERADKREEKPEEPLSDERAAQMKGTVFESCKTEGDVVARHFDAMS